MRLAMVFSSIIFLFLFLPITLGVYYFSKENYRNGVLLFFSLVFYFWGEGKYTIILIMYMVVNYTAGRFIERYRQFETSKGLRKAKFVLLLSIIFDLGFLLFYKYFVFGLTNLNRILAFIGYSLPVPQIHLPIGISFFTFQALSYVVDIYGKEVKAEKNIISFSMYKGLFPQLIAGPIIRYKDISNQVNSRSTSAVKFISGIKRFIIGLGKKVLIANTVSIAADAVFGLKSSDLSFQITWVGVICYSLQIYFDFSGYSDMAIGLGRMFGFDFLENFNYPYISKSIRDFWRRWHISLSSWFRDYVYIKLGGNRIGKYRSYLNLLVVFSLCGLWHGASWTFVVWGLWHGLFLVIERTKLGRNLGSTAKLFQFVYTILIVLVGWVFFRSESLSYAIEYLKAMFFMKNEVVSIFEIINIKIFIAIIIGIVGATPFPSRIANLIVSRQNTKQYARLSYEIIAVVSLAFIFILSASSISTNTYNPFIYFRF
jgi:alginate O-acetyltransferase complex protein AlgI